MMMVIRSTGNPTSWRNLQKPAINWSDDSSFQASLSSQPGEGIGVHALDVAVEEGDLLVALVNGAHHVRVERHHAEDPLAVRVRVLVPPDRVFATSPPTLSDQ